jgi:hypothetical protein
MRTAISGVVILAMKAMRREMFAAREEEKGEEKEEEGMTARKQGTSRGRDTSFE